MEDIKSRLKLLESDLKKLESRLKKGFATGTKKDWEHILHQTRKIEELSISQIAILKLQDKKNHVIIKRGKSREHKKL
ncbi:MAG TPA: hypothetical protein QF423_04465 [Candidatus Scalindua sp.]|jgi:hypothetical protein|nr:hypothetical protein [Candidatus Scalindua sp.]